VTERENDAKADWLGPEGRRKALAVAVAGLAVTLGGLWFSPAATLAAWLVSAFVFLALGLAAIAFLALMHVGGAGWHVALKRVVEAMAATVPVGAVTIVVLLAGLPTLYHWADPHAAHDPVLAAKHAFLSPGPFAVRMVAVLATWSIFGYFLRRASVAQDADGAVRHTRVGAALSAVFLLVFGWTFSLASVDWLMSLEPHWFSTIFGWYNLGGLLVSGVAAIAVLTILLRRRGLLPHVNDGHVQDLGRLIFGFSTLWAYLWLSQYLLIWYSNIPEETAWYVRRTRGGWSFLFYLNLAVGWALPFLALLPWGAKRHERHLLYLCVVVLAGRWLDVHLMVMPAVAPVDPGIGLVDVAAFAGAGGLFVLAFDRALGRAPLLPRSDPYLVESLHHRG
jgi:hypothetical protein